MSPAGGNTVTPNESGHLRPGECSDQTKRAASPVRRYRTTPWVSRGETKNKKKTRRGVSQSSRAVKIMAARVPVAGVAAVRQSPPRRGSSSVRAVVSSRRLPVPPPPSVAPAAAAAAAERGEAAAARRHRPQSGAWSPVAHVGSAGGSGQVRGRSTDVVKVRDDVSCRGQHSDAERERSPPSRRVLCTECCKSNDTNLFKSEKLSY